MFIDSRETDGQNEARGCVLRPEHCQEAYKNVLKVF